MKSLLPRLIKIAILIGIVLFFTAGIPLIPRTRRYFAKKAVTITTGKNFNQIENSWPDQNILDTLDKVKGRLANNYFPSPQKDGTSWLSVSQGQYLSQFYSRDTFVTARGAVYMGDPFLEYLKQAIRWFSINMRGTGYLPLWFRQTTNLNIYEFSPYNRNENDGGVRQIDHLLEYIDATWLAYSWSGDQTFLLEQLPYARSTWHYLEDKTIDHLIYQSISPYSGLDWADKVLRGGTSSFVQAYWYHSTISLAYLEKSAGNNKKYEELMNYAEKIKEKINRVLWTYSKPVGSDIRFGHYLAWEVNNQKHDYFEVDSNLFMVAEGIADRAKSTEIIRYYFNHLGNFENNTGATRVVLGSYDKSDVFDNNKIGEYQNGGYWYIVSYPVAKALAKNNHPKELYNQLHETLNTFNATDSGLAEWYYSNGKIGGAPSYSWSLAYPYYLIYNAMLGIETDPDGITISPSLPNTIQNISIKLKYRGKNLIIKLNLKNTKYFYLSNLEILSKEGDTVLITNSK